jgi:hypothetical protein
LHVVYINSCGPEDGRWTTETCRHIEFYNDILVIRAYLIVLCLVVYIAPSDCITQRMENTEIKLNVFDIFSKNRHISNFMKILPLGSQLFHACRQMDRRDEAISRFSPFLRKRLKSKVCNCTGCQD